MAVQHAATRRPTLGAAPNLPDRSSTAAPFGSARRTISPSSPATPVAVVSCRIFASSSALSSTKSRTPCRAHASRMAPRGLTGCMKWIAASGNIWRTSATSPIEAQSKCATPPAWTARSIAGSGLHFTAYSTSPGNAATNSRAVASTVAGRMQCIGSSGRSAAMSSSTEGSAVVAAGKRRRRGDTAERTRELFIAGILAGIWRARRGATNDRERMRSGRRAETPRRQTQPMLRVLRIAANRSANIGDSLTTPVPRMDRTDRKGRVTSLLCPEDLDAGLAARAMRQRPLHHMGGAGVSI